MKDFEYFKTNTKIPNFVKERFPIFILNPTVPKKPQDLFKKLLGNVILYISNIWIRKRRAPSFVKVALKKEDVQAIYNKLAKKYLKKHGIATYRKDDSWRLWVAQAVVPTIQKVNRLGKVAMHLDLFGGTGLSYAKEAIVFSLYGCVVHSIILDLAEGMLSVARKVTIPEIEKLGYCKIIVSNEEITRKEYPRTVEIIQGDATNLTGDHPAVRINGEPLKKASFDVMTIMDGVGSLTLDCAVQTSQDILKLLKINGRLAVTDSHHPIAELTARWQLPGLIEFRFPWLEKEVYERLTIFQDRLWGWLDPTLYPHFMQLAVIKDNGHYYGWQTMILEIESQACEFGCPFMPIYKQVLEKVEIDKLEAEQRIETTNWLINNLTSESHNLLKDKNFSVSL